MFDDVPVRVWLLLAIAAIGYQPALYVFRHIAHDPRRRDITAPPVDLSWRSHRQLAISGSILAGLLAFAFFIFTPAAERFARSPSFMPLLLGALGVLALFTVVKAMATGSIEPMIRGLSSTYRRDAHPRRFWASMGWNSVIGGLMLWMAVTTISSQSRERCLDYAQALTPQERLSACDEALAQSDLSREDRNDLYRNRGIARHELADAEQAIDDYNRAIDLVPGDSYALHNRGLLYLAGGQFQFALEDFSRSLRLRPDNKDGYANRAEAYVATGAFKQAIADHSRVLAIDPNDEYALVGRGMAYVWTDDIARARQDFDRARTLHPASVALLRGEGVLAVHLKDLETARRKLREAYDREPDHVSTLSALAEVHDRLGDADKAKLARQKLAALRRNQPR
ncbi:lipoprotein NlpI [Sphingomonas jeddahensis]|uniref:Lipoprotein NlpI n=2 Tax=Sphingomonas jeddahensis TaxID=1915074 RepID=A0A1V2ETD6_9SPHN|nr:lipoprotein NlpI [Sphingomonas jeddahensis]